MRWSAREHKLSNVNSRQFAGLYHLAHHMHPNARLNIFLPLKSVDLALSRVRERVSRGGHDVPEAVVRRRFDRSIHNFLLYYRQLGDVWTLFDNSGQVPKVVALERDKRVRIIKKSMYTALVNQYGRI